jgi:hypothetical protein
MSAANPRVDASKVRNFYIHHRSNADKVHGIRNANTLGYMANEGYILKLEDVSYWINGNADFMALKWADKVESLDTYISVVGRTGRSRASVLGQMGIKEDGYIRYVNGVSAVHGHVQIRHRQVTVNKCKWVLFIKNCWKETSNVERNMDF